MGVLEARKDAEKVWFPEVGKTAKDKLNVVDYDIHDEITIGKSSGINANNDTTTGEANVIPGVNAPKLKLSTSIYVDKLDIPTVYQTLYGEGSVVYRPDETSTAIRNMTSQASYGTDEITYYASPQGINYSGMKIPVAGYYELYARYSGSSSTYGWTYQWKTPKGGGSNDTIWHTYTTQWNSQNEYETITRYFEKGEVFSLFVTMNRSSSTPLQTAPNILIEVKKL